MAVCFDKGGSQDRIEIFEDYKANREETPEGIKIAIPIIEDILKSLNISILVKEGYEADDIIGTIAKKAKTQNFETYMVTPDKDFAQLVEKDIYMYRPVFGGGYETWGVKEVLNKFEISRTSQVIDFLAMKGDSVDNIPGLPGVGDKTAKKFLKEYGSLENLLENTSDLKGKIKEKIEANKELGILSKKLATIITNVPIDFEINEFKLEVKNLEKIHEIFDFLEFRRLSSSINSIFSNVEKTNPEIQNKTEEIIDSRTSDAIAMALRFNAPIFIYDSILNQAGFDEKSIRKSKKDKTEESWIQDFVEQQSQQKKVPEDLKKLSVSKLKSLLNKLVNLEDYEKAVKIRDEISKRENKT